VILVPLMFGFGCIVANSENGARSRSKIWLSTSGA